MIFNFSERKGALVLLFLITGVVIIPRQFRARKYDVFLLPEMEIVNEDSLVFKQPDQSIAPKTTFIHQKKKMPVIELNTADSNLLVKVKGIGPYYAAKILRYRERLGGFYSVSQLKELQMTYFNVDSSAHYFTANPALIHPRDLDTMSFKAILRHPYLEYEDVSMMFNAKRKYGKLSMPVLEENKILPAYKLKKIKPYFK